MSLPDDGSAVGSTADSSWRADTAAGSARALGASIVRALPRTPAIRFFAPKRKPAITDLRGEFRDGRLRLRAGFMAASVGASTLLFKAHTSVAGDASLGKSSTSVKNTDTPLGMHLIGGVAGGAIHGTVMTFAPRPDVESGCASLRIRSRVRAIPVAMVREGLGFGIFFAVHAHLISLWRPSSPARDGGGPLLSTAHLSELGTSCAAGAVAGGCYHVTTHPVLTAQELASPQTDAAAVMRAARTHGFAALYRGALRTSLPGLASGAAAFGVYDMVLRWIEGS